MGSVEVRANALRDFFTQTAGRQRRQLIAARM
jgi:hypothetical protein